MGPSGAGGNRSPGRVKSRGKKGDRGLGQNLAQALALVVTVATGERLGKAREAPANRRRQHGKVTNRLPASQLVEVDVRRGDGEVGRSEHWRTLGRG